MVESSSFSTNLAEQNHELTFNIQTSMDTNILSGVNSEISTPPTSATTCNPITTITNLNDNVNESPMKKAKLSNSTENKQRLLEDRLGSILSCCICLDLSNLPMYQCPNGHLMCGNCFSHLLADGKLKDELTTCPNCRCEINKSNCCRNLAVEKAISELPILCEYCLNTLLRYEIKIHQSQLCTDRPTACDYNLIGCTWNGAYHNLESHLGVCQYPSKAGIELLDTLKEKKQIAEDEKKCLETVVDLLSLNQIGVSDLVLKPFRTDDFVAKLYFETSRFTCLSLQWCVRARINDNTPHPQLTMNRTLSYQLVLKSKITQTIDLKFFILRGPHGDLQAFKPIIYSFEFSPNHTETEYLKLPISSAECNKLLSSTSISLRLLMVQVERNKE
ncbi:unnamed protein product [Didymodactylos carnosus]|uniref:RING-type domain-containing protein n=1 Tax=Didymodactylos carnosus TaxID=1234261 RepID=A0A813TCV4_9BILA|nr:unnamed protein product [Didymodactylos carnosus]CAF0819639.1 unnamed protein product [Didymodactylos carnosus]CAF3596072.1 unnamed protein product [Didymodactylos carnosus]CAF3603821.1 unnamed protein product [Didymodactylos carnosus]